MITNRVTRRIFLFNTAAGRNDSSFINKISIPACIILRLYHLK